MISCKKCIMQDAANAKTVRDWQQQQVVEVIWRKAASPPNTEGSVVFVRWSQCAPPSNRPTCFLGLTRVHIRNDISIGSAVFAELTIVADRPTDRQRQTDRPCYCNRSHLRSAACGPTTTTRHRPSTSTRWDFAFGAMLSQQRNPCTDCKSAQ